MPWAICLKNLEEGGIEIISADQQIDADDPRYDHDVHIAPCKDDAEDPECMTFGIHDFTRECVCKPTVREQANGQNLIIHSDQVN